MTKITEELLSKDDELHLLDIEAENAYSAFGSIWDDRLSIRENVQKRIEICQFVGATHKEIMEVLKPYMRLIPEI